MGANVTPESSFGQWPAFRVVMSEQGMGRTGTFEDGYREQSGGSVTVEVYATEREQLEDVGQVGSVPPQYGLLSQVEQVLVNASNYSLITFPGPANSLGRSPYYVMSIEVGRWSVFMVELVRMQQSEYLYCGTLALDLMLGGAAQSKNP